MKIKIMGKFLKWITNGKVAAITLCPFGIYFKEEWYTNIDRIVNHEKIHWKQQLEMFIVFFYLWYIIEWLIKSIFIEDAYRNISFEKESQVNDDNLQYLENRKHYEWIKYV